MPLFYQPALFGPGELGRPMAPEEEADETGVALLLFACAGTAGLLALGGGIAALVCLACAKELQRQYQILSRKGYYGCERRREEARRRFEAEIAALKGSPACRIERYNRVYADYVAELRRIDADCERVTRRRGADFGRETRRSPLPRPRPWRNGAPWESPKARASRRRRREKRLAMWREWAQKFAEAVRLGRNPPPSPAERRAGGGSPIRRLCERSSSPPPTPEALLAQYEKAKGRGPVEEKLRLGSMMLDIEAAVDSSLVRDPSGEIVGRKSGVRGWLAERCPELCRHYASLMGYRRLADEFRKVHGLRDPHPATRLLEKDFPAEAFAPAIREAMRASHAAARRRLASSAARTAKGLAKALARARRRGIVPRRRTG